MANIDPWERQEGETPKAFEAFSIYRDMGTDRTLRKVVQQLNKNLTTIAEWSSKYEWVDRVAAWDAELDRLARLEQIKDIKKMRKRHAELAKDMLDTAADALQRIDIDDIKAADISRLVDVATKIERISRGDSETIIEERDGGEAINPVQIYIPDNSRGRSQDEFDDLDV